jgi:hypothetical protein
MWPLCHLAFVRPAFRPEDFDYYQQINERFAEAIEQEATSDSPLVSARAFRATGLDARKFDGEKASVSRRVKNWARRFTAGDELSRCVSHCAGRARDLDEVPVGIARAYRVGHALQ